MNKILNLITVLVVLSCITGCNRSDAISKFAYTDNVRETAGEYIMYEIEQGTVTCREHRTRAELACWKN